jgi:hypothetical protein
MEVKTQLIIAQRQEFSPVADLKLPLGLVDEVAKLINGLRKSI